MKKHILHILLVALWAAGTLSAQNNVGIHTNNPQTALHVADDNFGTGGVTIGTGITSDGGNLRLLSNNNHWNLDNLGGKLRFFTETGFGNGQMTWATLSSSSKFGIGTDIPNATIHVGNDFTANNGITIGNSFHEASAPLRFLSSNNLWNIENESGNLIFTSQAGIGGVQTPRMVMSALGRIGIANSSPQVALDVMAANPAEPCFLTQGGMDYAGWLGQDLNFGHYDGITFNPAMTMSFGNTGLGTINPLHAFHVSRINPAVGESIFKVAGVNVGHTNYEMLVAGSLGENNLIVGANGAIRIFKTNIAPTTTLLQVEGQNTGSSDYDLLALNHGNDEIFTVQANGQVGINGVTNNAADDYALSIRSPNNSHEILLVERSNGSNVLTVNQSGNVDIDGTLSSSNKLFFIDHPLDPANKTLRHVCIESDEMKNVYDGTAYLDQNGEAWIALPNYFQALNTKFRYQFTCIGGHAPIFLAQEIQNNQFKIAGGTPGLEVSWQVTGVRQDLFARKNPLVVEAEKTGSHRGRYHHAEAYGHSKSLEIGFEHDVKK